MNHRNAETGAANPLLIASILLGLLAAGLAGFGVWAYMGLQDYKNNSDSKAAAAVEVAKKEQQTELEKEFIEREKQPYRTFIGPDDLGRVTFKYPKTWSVYVDKNDPGGSFEAYLQPGSVPPVDSDTAYATRVIVDDKEYVDSLDEYESALKKGELKSKPVKVNGLTGVRLDGTFSKTRSGSAVVFKLRDKTLTISCDSTDFRKDFDNVIVKTLSFNP